MPTYSDSKIAKNRVFMLMLDAATAVGDGVWFDISLLKTYTLHVKGITTATVSVTGSNGATQPADSAHETLVANGTFTADGFMEKTATTRYLKVRVSAHTTGTISGFLFGQTA